MSGMERVVNPISTGELERRWKAVRAAMEEQSIDVLIMQGFNEFIGGYVKYFTVLFVVRYLPLSCYNECIGICFF